MDRFNKKLCLTILLFSIVTVDFASMCKHGANTANAAFAYNHSMYKVASGTVVSNNGAAPMLLQPTAAQITWKQLTDVSYVTKYNKQFDGDIMYPVFGNSVKKLAGKEWVIAGYMIPLDIQSGLYAISQNTYAACFFCGAAGVESVVSIKFKGKPKRYKTDQYCYIKGTLELNDKNVNDFIYIFRNAVEVSK